VVLYVHLADACGRHYTLMVARRPHGGCAGQGDVKVVELTVWPPILGSERDGWAV